MFKIACLQVQVGASKAQNIQKTCSFLKVAATQGARIAVLPECFNSLYGVKHFEAFAESIPDGETCQMLKTTALATNMIIVGGSIPERKEGKLYNTCTIWGNDGTLLSIHRKIHLFDVDIKNKIRVMESEVLTPGDKITIVDTPYGKIGIGICYDIRFPELAMISARKGCSLMIYPGAFNMTTGPLHWELLQRARAVDNQIYVATCSPARDDSADYVAWGHSSVIDPMGSVISTMNQDEGILYAEIDPEYMQQVRDGIPVTKQRRFDVYGDISGMNSY